MYDVHNIAKYIIGKAYQVKANDITNLKLQKLLYYCYGYYLMSNNKSLFVDTFEAWRYGPVIPTIYHEYKHFGSRLIPMINIYEFKKISEMITPREKKAIDYVIEFFKEYNAIELKNVSHMSSAWSEAYNGIEKQ